MRASVKAIAYFLPEQRISNAELAAKFPGWSIDSIEAKTGIAERRIASESQCASDLGVAAAKQLFRAKRCSPSDIDYILFCTQSPDYFLPTTACIMQQRLSLPTTCGALDFNLGCSGFVYGLGLAKGLIETGQASNVLLITAETYSKFLNDGDRSVRALFGDAGAATLICADAGGDAQSAELIGPFAFGTDGSGAKNLIVPNGGLRCRYDRDAQEAIDDQGNIRTRNDLYMNGPEILTFTLRVIPAAISRLLASSNTSLDMIDVFVFHQANQFMLEHLRRKLHIPEEKFIISLKYCGNTVSSTIPIALCEAAAAGTLRGGSRVMLVGFGVGYSWGATLLRWADSASTHSPLPSAPAE